MLEDSGLVRSENIGRTRHGKTSDFRCTSFEVVPNERIVLDAVEKSLGA